MNLAYGGRRGPDEKCVPTRWRDESERENKVLLTDASTLAGEEKFGSLNREITLSRTVETD